MMESVETVEARLEELKAGDPESTKRIDVQNALAWEIGLTQTKRPLKLAEEAKAREDGSYSSGMT